MPADYFKEGKLRMAVWRYSTGMWAIKGPGMTDWSKSSGNVHFIYGRK